jgi:hypothetical protein
MDDEAKVILGIFLGWPILFVVAMWLAQPSPMQQCIKDGYEWIDNNCVDRD